MCIKTKKIGVFLNESRITWLLAFHMPRNAPTRLCISYWRAIYWASWMHWRRRILESKETIVHCCLTWLYLSLHPFVPLEHIVLLFPSFPLICELSIEIWRIEVVEDLVSSFWRCADKVCHCSIYVLLIEISISCSIHVHKYDYCIHGCIYLPINFICIC